MSETILELKGIVKSYPGVAALKGIDMRVERNEILGLVGENGAGKSTLMKIMIGLQASDEGGLFRDGKALRLAGPADAIEKGIGMVFQEGCMISNLSVMDNLFLGNEKSFMRFGFILPNKMSSAARKCLASVGLPSLDPKKMLGELSAAEKQMIEIARLLWLSEFYGVRNPVLILDEPTTVLQEHEVKILFDILVELRKKATIIFISHRLEEVVKLSDRIVVLKDGNLVAEMAGKDASVHGIEKMMVGHELAEEHYRESMQAEPGKELSLRVESLGLAGRFENFSLELRKGEIVSLVGLLGSGKEEVCACIGGSIQPDSGKIEVEGREVRFASPRDAIEANIGCIPIDRRSDGLATSLDVMNNINLLVLDEMKKGIFLLPSLERKNAERWVKECLIKTPSLTTSCRTLSGGNQQKVVIAKWLAADAKILILDHPTRGIDVGAKDEIYRRIRVLAASGMSIIVMCDTLEEDIGLCDRMIVMKDGAVVREIPCPKNGKPVPVDVIDYIV